MSSLPDRRAAPRGRGLVRAPLPLLLAVLPVVGACTGDGDTVRAASSPPSPYAASPLVDLLVSVTAGPGSAPVRVRLTCEPVGGDHPDPVQACGSLAAQPERLSPLGPDVACTEQYGGPQTADVRGSFRGEPVSLELSRTDGCRIAQWDALEGLLEPLAALGAPSGPGS